MPRQLVPRSKRTFRVIAFDIETTNLSADYGCVLCAAASSGHGKPHLFSQRTLGGQWPARSDADGPVIAALFAVLDTADFWVAHNGANFDLPFLFTRAARLGIKAPTRRALASPHRPAV
jgi:DNA polymerase elongation subunit (family B)